MGRSKKQWRKVHIDGGEWRYRLGTTFIPIYSPAGKKYLAKVIDIGWHAPSVIKNFIETEILKRGEFKYKSALHALAACAE